MTIKTIKFTDDQIATLVDAVTALRGTLTSDEITHAQGLDCTLHHHLRAAERDGTVAVAMDEPQAQLAKLALDCIIAVRELALELQVRQHKAERALSITRDFLRDARELRDHLVETFSG